MNTKLTFAAALLLPLAVWAAPATNAGSTETETTSSIRADRKDVRPADPRGRDNNFDPRRDDRRDNRYDPRDNNRRPDDRRPAPAPAKRPDYDRVIRHAYLDILEREPDASGLRNYRERLSREGWTEDRLRTALRDSAEFRSTVVNNIIARAYRDILGRAPDASGLDTYRYKIIARGMSEEELRKILLGSREYRDRMTMVAANTPRARR